MDVDEVIAAVSEVADELEEGPGMLRFVHDGIPMALLTAVNFDRRRLIAAVTDADTLDEDVKDRLLEANFHTALDARYGISRGLVFAAFLHPLSSLYPALLVSAIAQVACLVHTFGDEYTGGTLEFVGGARSKKSRDQLN